MKDRDRLPNLRNDRSVKRLVKDCISPEEADLTTTNQLHTGALLINFKIAPGQTGSNTKPGVNRVPEWKHKLQRQIDELREDMSIISGCTGCNSTTQIKRKLKSRMRKNASTEPEQMLSC